MSSAKASMCPVRPSASKGSCESKLVTKSRDSVPTPPPSPILPRSDESKDPSVASSGKRLPLGSFDSDGMEYLYEPEEWQDGAPISSPKTTPTPQVLKLELSRPVGLRAMLASSRLFMGPYKFRLASQISMSSNGSGYVNSVLNVATVSSSSDFSSLASVFGEFFVHSLKLTWMPQSIYSGPIGFVNTTLTQASNLPIVVSSSQHGTPAYSTATDALNNGKSRYESTGVRFAYTWKNVETHKVMTMVSPLATSAVSTQGWCRSDSTSAGAYTGHVQFLSGTTSGLPASAALGSFACEWLVFFRNRT